MAIGTFQNLKMDFKMTSSAKNDLNIKTNLTSKASESKQQFGKVFNQILQNKKATGNDTVPTSKDTVDVLESDDLKEALEVLEVPSDEALLFVQINEESVPVDQLLNSDTVAEMLSINLEELQQTVNQLTAEEVNVEDIWTMIEAAPDLLNNLQAALTEETGEISNNQAAQLLQFLKLAQLIGEKSDTVYTQQTQLSLLKETIAQVLVNVTSTIQPTAAAAQTTQSNLQQIIPTVAVEQKVEQASQNSSNAQNESMFQQHQQSSSLSRTVTVTLPTNQSSQSEALAKEIANLLNRSQVSNSQGTIKLMLKLFPENLGQIRIEIVQQNGVMSARLLASTTAGKELLDSSLNQLKSNLVAQNIQLERIDVAQALQETDKNFRDQNLFGNFNRQQQSETEQDDEQEEEEGKSFGELLAEEVQV